MSLYCAILNSLSLGTTRICPTDDPGRARIAFACARPVPAILVRPSPLGLVGYTTIPGDLSGYEELTVVGRTALARIEKRSGPNELAAAPETYPQLLPEALR